MAIAHALTKLVQEARWRPAQVAINWSEMRAFYQRRKFAPAWIDEAASEKARETLVHAGDEGLVPQDYAADNIRRPSGSDPAQFARFDLLLTDSLLHYAHDVHQGRTTPQLAYDEADLKLAPFDAVSTLNAALSHGALDNYLASLPPQQQAYQALKQILARYRQMEANGGWKRLPVREVASNSQAGTDNDSQGYGSSATDENGQNENGGNTDDASSGSDGSFGQQLKDRLTAENYNLDGGVREALEAFQRNHDLDATGVANHDTILALNIGVKSRIIQIEANMERWRWMPARFEPHRIEVNVPSEHLVMFDSGQPILQSRVVVGKESAPTPLLRAVATAITVDPVWHIPQDIAEDEILPKAEEDKSYLRVQKIVYSKHGTHQLRQLPGPKNALGTLKFDMPNRFDVYLHDTPGKSVFARNERDESHGCVRVERIHELASAALTGDPEADVGELKSMIKAKKTRKLALRAPLPVYILYWTVTQADDGSAQFWPDLYSRDQSLIAELQNRNVAVRPRVL